MLHRVCFKLHRTVGRELLDELIRVLSASILYNWVVRTMCGEEWKCFAYGAYLRLKSLRCYDIGAPADESCKWLFGSDP